MPAIWVYPQSSRAGMAEQEYEALGSLSSLAICIADRELTLRFWLYGMRPLH